MLSLPLLFVYNIPVALQTHCSRCLHASFYGNSGWVPTEERCLTSTDPPHHSLKIVDFPSVWFSFVLLLLLPAPMFASIYVLLHDCCNRCNCIGALLQSKAVAEHVGVLLDADEKFLIFSHHTDMHNAVEAAVRG